MLLLLVPEPETLVQIQLGLIREKPWREEVHFNGPYGRQDLFCRGTPLFDVGRAWQGAVVVFDDVSALLQAQRRAAWGEVAQRLAHEIKNPLTPIQLSAERLKHKLSKSLGEADAEVLDRSTRTIVQQVEAMKSMVNAFAEYAKPSVINPQPVDLRLLIEEVVALYPSQSGMEFTMVLEKNFAGKTAVISISQYRSFFSSSPFQKRQVKVLLLE